MAADGTRVNSVDNAARTLAVSRRPKTEGGAAMLIITLAVMLEVGAHRAGFGFRIA